MGTPRRSLCVLRCPLALKDEHAHWKGVFFDLLATLSYGQLAACFAFSIEDSLTVSFRQSRIEGCSINLSVVRASDVEVASAVDVSLDGEFGDYD